MHGRVLPVDAGRFSVPPGDAAAGDTEAAFDVPAVIFHPRTNSRRHRPLEGGVCVPAEGTAEGQGLQAIHIGLLPHEGSSVEVPLDRPPPLDISSDTGGTQRRCWVMPPPVSAFATGPCGCATEESSPAGGVLLPCTAIATAVPVVESRLEAPPPPAPPPQATPLVPTVPLVHPVAVTQQDAPVEAPPVARRARPSSACSRAETPLSARSRSGTPSAGPSRAASQVLGTNNGRAVSSSEPRRANSRPSVEAWRGGSNASGAYSSRPAPGTTFGSACAVRRTRSASPDVAQEDGEETVRVSIVHMKHFEAQLRAAKARIAALEAENSELHAELEATSHDLQAIIADVRVVALRDAHRRHPADRGGPTRSAVASRAGIPSAPGISAGASNDVSAGLGAASSAEGLAVRSRAVPDANAEREEFARWYAADHAGHLRVALSLRGSGVEVPGPMLSPDILQGSVNHAMVGRGVSTVTGSGSGCSGASAASSIVAATAGAGSAGCNVNVGCGGGAGSASLTPATLPAAMPPRRPGTGAPIIRTARQARPNGFVPTQPPRLDLSGICHGGAQGSEKLLHTPGRSDGR